ncbi:MAG TPA: cellulose synthase family protein [Bacteroidota bacterium]|jgi:cellulose synthase/poly-beta-1,6-N-acetylglucosamine synthase-like glycosyltransferase|nr:cellulose synthase family protein [Bacteroidota bacterium]
MQDWIIGTYFISLTILFLFGSSGFVMIYYYMKHRRTKLKAADDLAEFPLVTIQLPLYNEYYVIERLIDAVCLMDYPREKMEIQVLDDSTDETIELVAGSVAAYREKGFDIKHVRRSSRAGYKAGALKEGLVTATGEFIAVFDADFVPKPDFLQKTLPYFLQDKNIGLVQTRWEHLNSDYSFLTRVQAMALDGHFVIEQNVRNKAGFFINFNGTGGIWRKACIFDAGNWESDTLTEDLDLSYRAQLKGWKFKFLNDVTSPAELPSEINALKSQQFRWTKGAIETARKILPKVWKSKLPLEKKIHATFHLTNNIVFPFILVAGILNVPLIFIKHQGGYETYFTIMAVFVFAFIGSFLFYLYSQKDVYQDWQRRMLLFPLFMAGSMGFAVNNTKAVLEGLIRKKSEFVRTPKYSVIDKKDNWIDKKYALMKFDFTVIIEFLLALYCTFGVVASIYYLELAAVPFQLLFSMGFGLVAWLSIKHAWSARKIAAAKKSAA